MAGLEPLSTNCALAARELCRQSACACDWITDLVVLDEEKRPAGGG